MPEARPESPQLHTVLAGRFLWTRLGPDAHPIQNAPAPRRTTTSKVKKGFICNTSRWYVIRSRGGKSLRRACSDLTTRELVAAVNKPFPVLTAGR